MSDAVTMTLQEAYDLRDKYAKKLEAENERLRMALAPNAETKAAYFGKFSFTAPGVDENGHMCIQDIYVPWPTIKQLMAAIREHAARGK